MIRARLMAVGLPFALLGAGCDNSDAWHAPDPSLSRMQEQPRNDPFEAMEPVPPFTFPHGQSVHTAPQPTRALLEDGRARFDVHCAVCHGITGNGESVVATKMLTRAPPSLHDANIRSMTDDGLYDVITRGYGLMPSYAWQLPPDARWSVVYYVRALQRSQSIAITDLTPALQAEAHQALGGSGP